MSDRPYVQVDPQVNFGRPCMGGTGTSVAAVAEMVWAGEDVTGVADEFGVDRAAVLVACWFVAAYGLTDMAGRGAGRFTRSGRALARRWGEWASGSEKALWLGEYDQVADPPGKDG